MKNKLTFTKYASLLLGTIAMTFAGVNWQLAICAWIAPVCLLYYTRNTSKKSFSIFFMAMLVAGYVSQTCNNLFNIFMVGVINSLSFAVIFTVTYILDSVLYKKNKGFYSTLIFPTIYVAIEFLVSTLIGTSGIVGQTQFNFTALAQLSSFTGMFGITFIVVWFASVVNWVIENNFDKQKIRKSIMVYGSLFLVVIIYGTVRNSIADVSSNKVKVATISSFHNLHAFAIAEQHELKKATSNTELEIPNRVFATDELINKQIENTIIAAKQGAKIVVWNEDALILNENQINAIIDSVHMIASEHNAYVLIAYLEKDNTLAPKLFNNKNLLIDSEGEVAWEYMKAYLAPAEVPIVNAGEKIIPYVDTEYGRLGSVICYDLDFPNYLRQANKHNVDIMLVPAYDWETYANLHSKMAQFEALQSGFSIIRANGAGKNIVTDSKGKIIAEMNTFKTDSKILYAQLPMNKADTVYSNIGNLFSYLVILFLFIIIALRIVKK